MFACEWERMLRRRKGALLIAALLIAELLGILLFTKPYDRELEQNRSVYDSYLVQVEGSLTQEKRDWLEETMEQMRLVQIALSQLQNNYYSGNVEEEEFREQFDLLSAQAADYSGFTKLYTQYIFVREQDNRSFLYTGGWEVLLGDQEPDYLLLLALIFLLTPVFCQEYATQMDQLQLTQKRSARSLAMIKVLTGVLLAASLSLLVQLMRTVYFGVRFGLPHWDYSLQSLMSFGTTQKQLTLWQAYFLQLGLKVLGYVYAAVLILFLSVLLKKYNLTLMASIAVLPLLFLTVNSNDVFVRLPGPWALTIGSIYLNPSTYYAGTEEEPTILYQEASWQELCGILCTVLLILAAMILFIQRRNANRLLKKKRRVILAALAVLVLLNGCGRSETDPVCFNMTQSVMADCGNHVILGDIFLYNNILVNKNTGETRTFPLDAFSGETKYSGPYFYDDGEKVYYLKCATASGTSGILRQINDLLVAIDKETLEETVIYQWNQQSSWFFGLLDRESSEEKVFYINEFWIHGGSLYYKHGGDGNLYRMDLTTGKSELYLKLQSVNNVAYDGACLYYADKYGRVVCRDMDSGKEAVLEDVVTAHFYLTPDGICFLNARDDRKPYFWDAGSGEITKLADVSGSQIYWDEAYIWVDNGGGLLYRMDHDGSNCAEVASDNFLFGDVYIPVRADAIYVRDPFENLLYSLNKDTLEWTLMEN